MHKRQQVLIMIEGRRNVITKSKTAACEALRISRTKLDSRINLGQPIDRDGRITVDLSNVGGNSMFTEVSVKHENVIFNVKGDYIHKDRGSYNAAPEGGYFEEYEIFHEGENFTWLLSNETREAIALKASEVQE